MKTRGIKTNFLFNVAGPVMQLIIGLITIPIYISYIGAARYGVLSIIWILLGYFGFLDLGLTRASTNALSRLGPSAPREDRAKVLVTVFSINFVLGVLGGGVLYVSGSFLLGHFLAVSAELKPEIEAVLPWVSCLLPLALCSGLGIGALESRERFFTANMLQVIGTTAGLVLPVITAVFISPSLTAVVPAAVISRGLSAALILGFVFNQEGRMTLRGFDKTQFRPLLSYGGWVSLSSIAGPLLASLDKLVIASMLGAAAVAHYTVPMTLAVRSQLFAAALSRTLFPRMSRSTQEEAAGLAGKTFVTLAYGYSAVCAPAIVLARPFLGLWIGDQFASISGPIAELLFIGAYTNSLGFIFFSFFEGQGRPDINAKVHALEIFPYLIALWFAAQHFGPGLFNALY